jgi:hypothetical protein
MEKEGTSLQVALNAFLKFGLYNKNSMIPVEKFKITGYAKIADDLTTIKTWLAKGYPLYSGSGNHCFAIVGYSDALHELIAKNSYGPTWGVNGDGTFGVDYSEVGNLFSKYILYNVIDTPMIFQDVSESSPMARNIKWCLDKKYIYGYGTSDNPLERLFMPEKPITRAEVAQIIYNVFNNDKGNQV